MKCPICEKEIKKKDKQVCVHIPAIYKMGTSYSKRIKKSKLKELCYHWSCYWPELKK